MKETQMRKKTNPAKKLATFPVLIEQDKNGMYVGTVPTLRSCYTQGTTLPELYKNLQEVISLCIEVDRDYFKQKPKLNRIIGFQNLDVVIS